MRNRLTIITASLLFVFCATGVALADADSESTSISGSTSIAEINGSKAGAASESDAVSNATAGVQEVTVEGASQDVNMDVTGATQNVTFEGSTIPDTVTNRTYVDPVLLRAALPVQSVNGMSGPNIQRVEGLITFDDAHTLSEWREIAERDNGRLFFKKAGTKVRLNVKAPNARNALDERDEIRIMVGQVLVNSNTGLFMAISGLPEGEDPKDLYGSVGNAMAAAEGDIVITEELLAEIAVAAGENGSNLVFINNQGWTRVAKVGGFGIGLGLSRGEFNGGDASTVSAGGTGWSNGSAWKVDRGFLHANLLVEK